MPDRKPRASHAAVRESTPAAKTCAACGRTITWRKKWERDWESIRFCSDACRAHKPGTREAELEEVILRLLRERGAGKTICPSEAARTVAGKGTLSNDATAWQPLMEPARAAARRLVASGTIDMTQGGHAVDPSTAKGAVRLRLR